MSQTSKQLVARSPGKLILSGEHSVVYGAPALVAAIDRYTEVWFTPIHRSRTLQTAFENLSKGHIYPVDAIKAIKQKLDERFDAFAQGKIPVQNILQRPEDLAIYALAQVIQSIPMPGRTSARQLPVPGRLNSRSDLPLGAGMGSSAAIIAAILVLYEHFLGKQQSLQKRFEWVRFCERLQHGKGGAADAAAVTYGGLNKVTSNDIKTLTGSQNQNFQLGGAWYWVLSGIPSVSTGECVTAVRQKFAHDHLLWQAFSDCTTELEQALLAGRDVKQAIRENHFLLNKINVVTQSANQFVQEIEALGGAAKISGAGAVKGTNSGTLLVQIDDREAMAHLMEQYSDWSWGKFSVAQTGAHLAERPMTAVELEEAQAFNGIVDTPAPAH